MEGLAKVLPGVESIEEGLKIFTILRNKERLESVSFAMWTLLKPEMLFYMQVFKFIETFTLKRRKE